MKACTRFLALAYTLLLVGCVALQAPQSFDERLAYGYAGVAAARSTATAMLERGRLTVAEARDAQGMADTTRTALDVARGSYKAGDISTATGQLDLALKALVALEGFLKAKEQP